MVSSEEIKRMLQEKRKAKTELRASKEKIKPDVEEKKVETSMEVKNVCSSCGNENAEDAKFCVYCGQKLEETGEMIKDETGTIKEETDDYSTKLSTDETASEKEEDKSIILGSSREIICPVCKTKNPEEAKLCYVCGKRFGEIAKGGLEKGEGHEKIGKDEILQTDKPKTTDEIITDIEDESEVLERFKNICPSCGNENPVNAKFCVSCGEKLKESKEIPGEQEQVMVEEEKTPEHLVETKEEDLVILKIPENVTWIDKCPVCKSSKLQSDDKVKSLGITVIERFKCDHCGAVFTKKQHKYELSKIKDTSYENWKKYRDQALTEQEWTDIAYRAVSTIPESETKAESIDIKIDEGTEPDIQEQTIEKELESQKIAQGSAQEIDPLDKIKKAKELLDMGAITQEEFERVKKKYLEDF